MKEKRAHARPQRARRRYVGRVAPRASANGHVTARASAPGDGGRPDVKVVNLVTGPSPEASASAAVEANRCAKCRSTFVMREPAFLHCYYCGAMTRIPSGSLLEQELFELRSGLRLAS